MSDDRSTDHDQLLYVFMANAARLESYISRRMGAALRSFVSVGDIMQGMWARALQSYCPSREYTDEQAYGWLKMLAYHEMVDQAKRCVRRPGSKSPPWMQIWKSSMAILYSYLLWPGKTPSSLVRTDELAAMMMAVLDSLPQQDQRIAWLRFVDHYHISDIAEYEGITVDAARRAVLRARRCMQGRLEAAMA